jgi:hypothetical protein
MTDGILWWFATLVVLTVIVLASIGHAIGW